MFASATDRQLLVDQVSRLVSSGSAPVALWGAGRVYKQLRERWHRVDLDEHIVGVIDDDPAKHGSTSGGLQIISADEAIRRGVRGVIITAEGQMQDRMWSQRGRFASPATRVLCCPERFASKTWDDCLIDQYEYSLAKDAKTSRTYEREYPPADDKPAPAVAELIRSHIAAHASRLARTPDVCEIGSGSGKWTAVALPTARGYHCVDYSERLLFEVIEHRFAADRAKNRLHLHHDETARLDGVPDASVDFAFSIDVFVHFKIDLVHQFMMSIKRVLRPAGTALLHLADWNTDHLKVWHEHYQQFHTGGTTPLHPVHPDWLRVSGDALGLDVRVLNDHRDGWRYFAELTKS